MPTARTTILAITSVIFINASFGQSQVTLEGSIDIELSKGLLAGDVCLVSEWPEGPTSFLLNRGLNIARVFDDSGSDLEYEGFYDGTFVGEGVLYSLKLTKPSSKLCIAYRGAFPLYDVDAGQRNVIDFKGWIAFNGRNLRAAEQSKWYPIPYDTATEEMRQELATDLKVSCQECRSIYLNGHRSHSGPQASFVSANSRMLLLFAGNFGASEVEGVQFINGPVSPEKARIFLGAVDEISDFFEKRLGIKYDDRPAFLTFASVSRSRQIDRSTWGFNSWPTIAFDGRMDFDSLVEEQEGSWKVKQWLWSGLSHEMAHYYFGTVLVPRGRHRWFFLESTAEYLSLKAVEHFQGKEPYESRVGRYIAQVQKELDNAPLLEEVQSYDEIGETYRYRLGPLLLIGLEQRIGSEATDRLLASLLSKQHREGPEFDWLQKEAILQGVPSEQWDSFRDACLQIPLPDRCVGVPPIER